MRDPDTIPMFAITTAERFEMAARELTELSGRMKDLLQGRGLIDREMGDCIERFKAITAQAQHYRAGRNEVQ